LGMSLFFFSFLESNNNHLRFILILDLSYQSNICNTFYSIEMSDCEGWESCKGCLSANCLFASMESKETACVPSQFPYLENKDIVVLLYKGDEDLCPHTLPSNNGTTSLGASLGIGITDKLS